MTAPHLALVEQTEMLPTLGDLGDPLGDLGAPPPIAPPAPAEAPYGQRKDGTPKAKPGRKPGPAQRGPGGRFMSSKAPGGPTPKAPKSGATSTIVDYRPALLDLTVQATGALAIAGLMAGKPALIADAAAVDTGAPALAESLNTAAETWPLLAAVLDKVCKIGPHLGGGAALVGMLGQIAVNHGMIPPGIIPGTMPPAQYAQAYIARRAAEDADFAHVLQFVAGRQAAQATQAAPNGGSPA